MRMMVGIIQGNMLMIWLMMEMKQNLDVINNDEE
jgi:hypothetical protein